MTKIETKAMPPSLQALVRLSHHRWIVPMVAEIGRGRGQRFAVLASWLEVSGQSLRRALDVAEAANLVMPNPGYGHPLRPEYLLTPWGEAIAAECLEVIESARQRSWNGLAGRKWSLPVLAAITLGHERYSEIGHALPTATPRALAKALEELTQAGCVARTVVDERPPRSVYAITRSGRRLARAAVALAAASAFS